MARTSTLHSRRRVTLTPLAQRGPETVITYAHMDTIVRYNDTNTCDIWDGSANVPSPAQCHPVKPWDQVPTMSRLAVRHRRELYTSQDTTLGLNQCRRSRICACETYVMHAIACSFNAALRTTWCAGPYTNAPRQQ